jgi:hypothetical protein
VDCCVVRSRHANCWVVRRGKSSPSPPPPPRRRHRCRPPPPAALIFSPPSSDGEGQSAATWGPPIPVQGQPIHNQAVRAPPRLPPPPPPNPPTPRRRTEGGAESHLIAI